MLNICLRSVTVLVRLSKMAGVTAQQIMRRKYKINIRHVQSGSTYTTEVLYGGNIVAVLPDDCLASNTHYQTVAIYRSLPKVLFEYPVQPAYASLPGKNVLAALASWDRERFEEDLLPLLNTRPELVKHVEVYMEVRDGGEEAVAYELYDVLVRLYVYCREHNIQLQRRGVQGLKITPAIDALKGDGFDCIELCDNLDAALRIIHKDHVEVEHEGKKYLIDPKPVSAMRSAGGDHHLDMSEEQIQQLLTAGDTMQAVKVSVQRGGVDVDTKSTYTGLVARVLGQGGVPSTPEEKDLVRYRDLVVTQGLVGKNAMVGLGKIFGQGPLGERLDAGFMEVCRRARGMSAEDCYKLAASRLAGMNSAKVVIQQKGQLVLCDRLAGVEEVGGARVPLH